MSWIALSDKTAGYSAQHHPLGQGGLWKHKGWQLPAYIQNVAKGLMESGKDRSTAIAMAVAAVERWKNGGDKVSPEVQAASTAAWAEWEKLKGQAHSTSRTGSALELNQVASAAGAARYNLPIGTQLGANGKPLPNQTPGGAGAAATAPGQISQQAKQLVSSMPDAGLLDAHQRLSAMGASGGPDVAAAKALVAAELAKRGYATAADGSIGRTQIGQGGLAQQAHQQANQAAAAAKQHAAAAKLAAQQAKAAAKPAPKAKTAPKAKAAPKPKAAPKAKKPPAPPKPHWFTNPASALELSTQVGYSGQGPRITDRYGIPVVDSRRRRRKA